VGKGEGVISLRMFPNNDIEMTGEVELIEGDYLFTYSDVLRRRFQVKPGGTVNFQGDPYNPQMRITATYTTKTSPYPLVVSILGGEGNISEADRQDWEENSAKR
jgi:translocation and assembly module TamB